MFNVFLLLGGNLGNREETLSKAIEMLEEKVGKVLLQSSVYETEAWGLKEQPDFLNKVILLQTSLAPYPLVETTQQIEHLLGRERKDHWGARTIDIDILIYENLVLTEVDLTIPHRFLAQRKFVLEPLREVAPDLIHPVLNETISALYARCEDLSEVRKHKKI